VQFYETHKAPEGIWSCEPEGTVGIDYLIGNVNYLHKNLGTQMVKKLVSYICIQDKYKYIIADPTADNLASVSVLQKNGFVKQDNGLFLFEL
jgi:RimJ/RimL family protein N-acetyltransferase